MRSTSLFNSSPYILTLFFLSGSGLCCCPFKSCFNYRYRPLQTQRRSVKELLIFLTWARFYITVRLEKSVQLRLKGLYLLLKLFEDALFTPGYWGALIVMYAQVITYLQLKKGPPFHTTFTERKAMQRADLSNHLPILKFYTALYLFFCICSYLKFDPCVVHVRSGLSASVSVTVPTDVFKF
jgi:hypothetical protein